MIEPKEFYRKLDSLLNKIGHEKTGHDYLFTITKEIENTFGTDLHLAYGRIFEKSDDEFFLISPNSNGERSENVPRISLGSDTVQSILKSKTYIFDNPVTGIELLKGLQNEYSVPVAITVHNQDYRWIIVFDLKSGWVREEIELCLNAVRTSLNYRLFSESIKSELEQAAQIQKSLLPTQAPEIPNFQIAGCSQPAELVGGDLFDYYKFGPNEFGVCIGDASGHGIPAALMARDAVIGLRMGLERNMKMVYTFKKLNSVLYQNVYSTRFISLFYAEIEQKGNLFYINAGHPSPILVNDEGISRLESTGLLLGALPEIEPQRSFTYLSPNSVLVLFTDCIFERENNEGKEFGLKRLENLILQNKDMNADEILNIIFRSVDKFGNNKAWKDDATVIVIKKTN